MTTFFQFQALNGNVLVVRQEFKLDGGTFRVLIESEQHHLKTFLDSRYMGFYKKLMKSPKFITIYLARFHENHMRNFSVMTLRYLGESCVSDSNFRMSSFLGRFKVRGSI